MKPQSSKMLWVEGCAKIDIPKKCPEWVVDYVP